MSVRVLGARNKADGGRCQDCIVHWIGSCEDQNKTALCPMCDKGPVGMSDLRSVQRRRKRVNPITGAYVDGGGGPEKGRDGEHGAQAAVSIGQVDLVSSTKLRALVRRLEAIRDEEPTFKALVFSQFTSFLGESLLPAPPDDACWRRQYAHHQT